jgi:hypothetical protein
VWCSVWGTNWILKYYSDERQLQRVNDAVSSSEYRVVWLKKSWVMNHEAYRRKPSSATLRTSSGICLERLRKPTKRLMIAGLRADVRTQRLRKCEEGGVTINKDKASVATSGKPMSGRLCTKELQNYEFCLSCRSVSPNTILFTRQHLYLSHCTHSTSFLTSWLLFCCKKEWQFMETVCLTAPTVYMHSLWIVDWLLWWGETAVSELRRWAYCSIPRW